MNDTPITEVVLDFAFLQERKGVIREEHWRAELERLRAGFEGCGCPDCQWLYHTTGFDLSKYGKRVVLFDDFISITAGRAGADLWDQYHRDDDAIIFSIAPQMPPDASEVVSKPIVDGFLLPQVIIESFETPKKKGGRPRKTGEMSRITKWRRTKEGQGILI